jgi:hypothetical protein
VQGKADDARNHVAAVLTSSRTHAPRSRPWHRAGCPAGRGCRR